MILLRAVSYTAVNGTDNNVDHIIRGMQNAADRLHLLLRVSGLSENLNLTIHSLHSSADMDFVPGRSDARSHGPETLYMVGVIIALPYSSGHTNEHTLTPQTAVILAFNCLPSIMLALLLLCLTTVICLCVEQIRCNT